MLKPSWVFGTTAKISGVAQASALLRGEETDVFAGAGCHGAAKPEEAKDLGVIWPNAHYYLTRNRHLSPIPTESLRRIDKTVRKDGPL